MKTTIQPTLGDLAHQVRYATEPDNPQLLDEYLAAAWACAARQPGLAKRNEVYLNVARLMLDVICDTYLPRQWRNLCLDHIYMPILTCERLANTSAQKRKVAKFKAEFRILGNYFL